MKSMRLKLLKMKLILLGITLGVSNVSSAKQPEDLQGHQSGYCASDALRWTQLASAGYISDELIKTISVKASDDGLTFTSKPGQYIDVKVQFKLRDFGEANCVLSSITVTE